MKNDPPRTGEGDRPGESRGGGGGPRVVDGQPIRQVKRARGLRRRMSLPEALLWRELRKRPGGFKFRRQVPLTPYVLDFACLSSRLAIEVDGASHEMGDGPSRDLRRDTVLAQQGFQTLRIPARDVLKDVEICVTAIVAACREGGPPPPSARADGPPPRSGED